MDEQEPQFLEVDQGPDDQGPKRRRIAYRWADSPRDGSDVAILWLPGFLSDMASTKALALGEWARGQGHAMLRFDYSGHGVSSGDILEASIGHWLEEATAMLGLLKGRRVILIGSSMGGWIALLMARAWKRASAKAGDPSLAGLVLIAPAWDMTEKLMWEKMSPETRAQVETEGVYFAPSDYGDPYPLTKILIEEGRNHLLAEGDVAVAAPVRILQGMEDPQVPWRHALALVDLLACDDVTLTLVKGGDHSLSEPDDLRRLERTVAALAGTVRAGAA